MENDVQNELGEPRVWTVESDTWTCNVPMNAYNAGFDDNTQAYEAATQAVEAYKGKRSDLTILLKDGCDMSKLGAGLLVYPRDNRDKAVACMVHECLANMGLYKESFNVHQVVKKIFAEAAEKQKRLNDHNDAIAQFEKAIAPKKKRTRKPKKPVDEPPKAE